MVSQEICVWSVVGDSNYKPRHLREYGKFKPRELNIGRERDQRLHKTAQWVKFRRRFLAVNPTCYCCGKNSTVVDHLEPSKGRKDVFERTANHLSLCSHCHNTITGKFDYKFQPGSDMTPKLKWLAEERTKNEVLLGRKFPPMKVLRYEE